MFQYFHNVNAYVEEADRYGTDSVKLELDEDAKQVTVKLVDYYKAETADAPLVDETFEELTPAIKFYEEMAHQLSQGDVIRNLGMAGKQLRKPYDADNSRYPSY